jgi:hypothetical protein
MSGYQSMACSPFQPRNGVSIKTDFVLLVPFRICEYFQATLYISIYFGLPSVWVFLDLSVVEALLTREGP